jgi:hypothetical protein
MEWQQIQLPAGTKLFKVHSFAFLVGGTVYQLEIDEFANGTFTGHGEHPTDKSNVLESVSGRSVGECLEALVGKIQACKSNR